MSQRASGFVRALSALREAGVDFVVVGVGGINFYARTPGQVLTAIHRAEGQIDLMTSMAGFSYEELERDATTFRVAGALVRVGRLEKLLRSKERSGRPKDLEFLRAFEARAVDEPGE